MIFVIHRLNITKSAVSLYFNALNFMSFKVLNMKIPWRREKPPTPVFWPGEFHGLYSPWGRKESDTTE